MTYRFEILVSPMEISVLLRQLLLSRLETSESIIKALIPDGHLRLPFVRNSIEVLLVIGYAGLQILYRDAKIFALLVAQLKLRFGMIALLIHQCKVNSSFQVWVS